MSRRKPNLFCLACVGWAAAAAARTPVNGIDPPAYDDWHYPPEEVTEAPLMRNIRLVSADESAQACDLANSTATAHGARVGGAPVLGGWVVLAVIPSPAVSATGGGGGAGSVGDESASPICVVERRLARWGAVVFLSSSPPGVVATMRTSVGRIDALEPLDRRAFNYTAADPTYWTRARDDPDDYIGQRLLDAGRGEPGYGDAARWMAPSRDFGLIGHPGSTMAWVVMPDGRIKRGDGEQGHPDDGHAAVPGLLVFEPNRTVSHWPSRFTSYKSSLLGRWLRAVHVGAWDATVGKGFEELAIAPNASADAQVLVRIGEVSVRDGDTVIGGTPSDGDGTGTSTGNGGVSASSAAPTTRYRYFRAGDSGPDHVLSNPYQEQEPDGRRFYAEMLRLAVEWDRALTGGMTVRLPDRDRRVGDMAVAALTAGVTLFRDLVPNYGTGNYWSLFYPDTPTVPCRLHEGACASLPMQTFALDNALVEWGHLGLARDRIAFFLERFVRPDGTLNMQDWNSQSEPSERRCPFDAGGNSSSPQMNDGLADYGRVVEMWVHAANASAAAAAAAVARAPGDSSASAANAWPSSAGSSSSIAVDAWINATLPTVLRIGRYMLRLRQNATQSIDPRSAMHGMVWGPAEHDTCGASDYHLNVQAWCWRGQVELSRWLKANRLAPELAGELAADAVRFRADLARAVEATSTPLPGGGVFLSPILCDPAEERPYPPTCAELRTPYANLTQATPATRSTSWYTPHSIPAYANFRYYGETLLASALPAETERGVLDYRATHGATLSGMTRYLDHLDDMPAVGYGWGSMLHAESVDAGANDRRFQALFSGHLANYQSRGTFAASEQMSIYGDGVYRDYLDGHGGGPSVDAEYCVPSSMLAAYFLKWSLVYVPRDVDEVWLARAAPRRWFSSEGFSVSHAPTRLGVAVSLSANATSTSGASGSWMTSAEVTLRRGGPSRNGGGGDGDVAPPRLPLVRLRVRCSEAAAAAGAALTHAVVTGGTLVSLNATSETVVVRALPKATTEARFSVAATCATR